MISQERLKYFLFYDPETGEFIWLRNRGQRGRRGSKAGRVNDAGYAEIGIDGYLYKAHRLAWFYMFGEWPEYEIDHRNNIRSDNRISNLRPATHKQNAHNRLIPKNNQSGVKGVDWHKASGKWRLRVCANGETFTEYYDDLSDAEKARDRIGNVVHGKFNRNR
jgi:hypothetical protein